MQKYQRRNHDSIVWPNQTKRKSVSSFAYVTLKLTKISNKYREIYLSFRWQKNHLEDGGGNSLYVITSFLENKIEIPLKLKK